ncbi:MAG TPA: 3-isopropylmalate dehydratase small subunit [Candidatus Latescibacteria bacterium]|nr:3-isopropylmalate dehydratase small subunit [Candidatus Latescibacterota bacterium]
MILRGRAWKFGDDVSTDLICPGRYFHLRSDLPGLARHLLEDADPDFVNRISKGDFIIAGKNFGQGSSREHAPRIIKLAGIGAVLARSFARIFYRNAINIGLPVLECATERIDQGDRLEVDIAKGVIVNETKGIELKFHPLPSVMLKILSDGGLIAHIRKHGDLILD